MYLQKRVIRFVLFFILSTSVITGCGGKGGSAGEPQIENGNNTITVADGGTVTYNDEIRLTIPENSLSSDADIKIEPVKDIPAGGADGLQGFGQAYKFTPGGTTFNLSNPAVMELKYDEALLLKKGYSPDMLGLYYYDEEIGQYVAVASYVDISSKKIIALVEHFTIYMPMAKAKLAANNKPYVALQNPVPNPVRAGAPIYIRATVRDYDGSLAGVRVYYRKLHPAGGTWSFAVMKREVRPNTVDTYGFVVPGNFLKASDLGTGNDIEFYVKATDNLGGVTTSTTRRLDVTRTYNSGSLNLSPVSLNIAAGFERYFTVRGTDSASASFQLIPETYTLLLNKGTLLNHGAGGILFRANSLTTTGSPEKLSVSAGTDIASADITIYSGELKGIEILDTTGNTTSGNILIQRNDSYSFDVMGVDEFGNKVPVYPSWSTDSSIGTIDGDGKFTASGTGTGKVYVSLGEYSDDQRVKIQARVDTTSPANNVQNIPDNTPVQIIFSDPVNSGSVDDTTIRVKRISGSNEYNVSGSFSTSGNVVTFTPSGTYISNEWYRIEVTGGVEDNDGTPVVPYTFTFRVFLKDAVYLESMFVQPNESLISFSVGRTPQSITSVDFNGDGIADVATANCNSNNVSILTGKGDGTFNAALNFATGTQPASIATGDFNKDGKADLVVANSGSKNVSILAGKGDGTFNAAVNYAAGTCPFSIITGDFNGDGKADLAVANNLSSNVSILMGKGNGTFNAALNLVVSANPNSITNADFNGDGIEDLAVTNGSSSNVNILTGKGDGTFNAVVNFSAGIYSMSVTTGDFNGDGIIDLAMSGTTVSILIGNGNATFKTAYICATTMADIRAIKSGDFNADGKTDIAVVYHITCNIGVFIGNGDGTFNPAVDYSAGGYPYSLLIYDFNGDGKNDIAVASSGNDKVYIVTGKGDGTFNAAVSYVAGNGPFSILTSDLNGDGIQDLAVSNAGNEFSSPPVDGSLSIHIGKGDGTFYPAVYNNVGGAKGFITESDFNKDGKTDIAVANQNSGNISILAGKGDGTFNTAVNYTTGTRPVSMAAADFNGDGNTDIAVVNQGGGNISILINKGNGTFNPAMNFAAGSLPESITSGDFNGDGKVDLTVVNRNSIYVSIFIGKGNGTFNTALNYSGGGVQTTGSLISLDLNGDGKLDILVANDTNVSKLIGKGNGTFYPAVTCAENHGYGLMSTGDFNGDGKLDIVAVGINGFSSIMILAGNGDGTFNPAVFYSAGIITSSVATGDFNNDGKADIAVTNYDIPNVSVANDIIILLHK